MSFWEPETCLEVCPLKEFKIVYMICYNLIDRAFGGKTVRRF